ncbi:MAG: phosphoadenosine phosphosulfate reductase family protein [Paludibacteraceae bacterium]|nr:phosphoadenosine phosphosulfate reductase family protein [Paludibacteraceae bacterium]
MFKIEWDIETGGVKLSSMHTVNTLGIAPRPVFYEELDLLKLYEFGWVYTKCEEPLLWACNKQYFYRGELVFEVSGANIYDPADVKVIKKNISILPVDLKSMLEKCQNELFLLESKAIEFIRDVYEQYSTASKSFEKNKANQIDFEELANRQEKRTKQKIAIVKEDCDSFDIMPLEKAINEGKKIYQTTKIDFFLASFSGGKDSQVVLDLCTRALPPDSFQVIYSDTGYELPTSLKLYEDVQRHYNELFPTLKFGLAKNHESVLNYWDTIGTPSDKHRWCCAVMKTAPLYRMLKVPGTNKQAKVLAFEGVRSEESTKRSGYERIGKGVKHSFVTNARPILRWNTTEVFLYIFKHNLLINAAYRVGKPRVGCIFCPFSSPWDDMVVNRCYKKDLQPFLEKVEKLVDDRKIPNKEEYIKERKWKLRASGNLVNQNSSVDFIKTNPDLVALVANAKVPFESWLITVADYVIERKGTELKGELKYNNKIYSFDIQYKDQSNYTFTLHNAVSDIVLSKLIKRVLYKATYCISCEVCEVECPTGALSVYPEVKIDKSKCIHCHKCLDFHDHGCIAADSLVTSMENKKNVGNISKYGTFGIREEWVSEFFIDPQVSFWLPGNNSLGNKQVPSFKAWMKDAEIIDTKNVLTKFGEFCVNNITNDPDLIWSLIWINVGYNSELVKWYINNVKENNPFNRAQLTELAYDYFSLHFSRSTIEYAFQALMQNFAYSPFGSTLLQGEAYEKKMVVRREFSDLSEIALAYSLYKYAEKNNATSLRVKDFYEDDCENGVAKEFCLSKDTFEKGLRTLNSQKDRVLVAELNMGLNHITLQEGLSSIDVLNKLF